MIFFGGNPAPSNPATTAATTAGRVPLFGPGMENTFNPTTSWVETRLRQASVTLGFSVRAVIARFIMAWIFIDRGRKASVASGSCAITTLACGPWFKVKNGSVASSVLFIKINAHTARQRAKQTRLVPRLGDDLNASV